MLLLNKKIFLFLFYVFLWFVSNVKAQVPTLNTTINYGHVVYNYISKAELIALSEKDKDFNKKTGANRILGFTAAELIIRHKVKFKYFSNKIIEVKEINFYIGYETLHVFIEDKYKKGSCEYEAIKEHEDGHVKIHRTELKYYGDLIVQEVKKIISSTDFKKFTQNFTKDEINSKLKKMIVEDSNVKILMSKLNNSLRQKHNQHDSEEEYTRVHKLCNRW